MVVDRLILYQFRSSFVHRAFVHRVFVHWISYHHLVGTVSLYWFSYCSPWFLLYQESGAMDQSLYFWALVQRYLTCCAPVGFVLATDMLWLLHATTAQCNSRCGIVRTFIIVADSRPINIWSDSIVCCLVYSLYVFNIIFNILKLYCVVS